VKVLKFIGSLLIDILKIILIIIGSIIGIGLIAGGIVLFAVISLYPMSTIAHIFHNSWMTLLVCFLLYIISLSALIHHMSPIYLMKEMFILFKGYLINKWNRINEQEVSK
jgi:hypothetical protein